jgi:hypothetical protein
MQILSKATEDVPSEDEESHIQEDDSQDPQIEQDE